MEIMMAGPMVRRLLDGTKTQTRRTGARWLKVKPGDVLHVREAFGSLEYHWLEEHDIRYRADCDAEELKRRETLEMHWTPAVHMPLHLCRMRLLVKRVWQERADSISEADAIAEGMAGVTVEDLIEMAKGGSLKIMKALEAGGWTAVAQWLAVHGWPRMSPVMRYRIVLGILGAKPDDVVTAIEFEVRHVNR